MCDLNLQSLHVFQWDNSMHKDPDTEASKYYSAYIKCIYTCAFIVTYEVEVLEEIWCLQHVTMRGELWKE